MKKIIYIFFLLIVYGCKKEKPLEPNVNFDSPYVLTDDPNHPVNHKRYLIYKEYGVPVYFTDTVNKVFVSKNIHGDSVYTYEKLDLNWSFSSVATIDYKFDQISNEADQLKALENIERYLKGSIRSFDPFSIFLVDNFTASGNSNVLTTEDVLAPLPKNKVTTLNAYRTLVISQAQKNYTETFWKNLSLVLLKNQVKKEITGEAYKASVLKFQTLSDPTHYDKYWQVLGINTSTFTPIPWRTFDPKATYSAEQEAIYANIRSVFGQFGFINFGTFNVWYSPNITNDRDQYIDALMNYDQETFDRLWGGYPLVMEKYEIMKDIIINDMKVPLDEIVK